MSSPASPLAATTPPQTGPPRAPALLAAPLREARLLREPLRRLRARRRLAGLPRGDGGPVLVLPGMHVGDWSTFDLRRFLRRLGWDARGWELGMHRADVLHTLPKVLARLEAVAADAGRSVALVGWSLGGVVAREAARLRPDLTRAVVTLGAPVVGGPKYVAVSYPYRRRGWDLDELERLVDEAARVPIRVPLTAIYSRRDGIVDWRACLDRRAPDARHVEVESSHWGLGVDPDALVAIARALAEAPAE
jgi:pimeloyl-ACP methyl ester carboxylesterase